MQTTADQTRPATRRSIGQSLRRAKNLVGEIIDNFTGQPGRLNKDELRIISNACALAGIVALRRVPSLLADHHYAGMLREQSARTAALLDSYLDGLPFVEASHAD